MKNFYSKPKLISPLDSYCDNSTDDENISNSNSFYFSDESLDNKENEIITILKNKRQKTIIDETKFKTELCKNWQTKGFCNYEGKCKFAHGAHELIKKEFINKNVYKSKPCMSFQSKHFCPYGLRCLFIHQEKPLKQIIETNYYTKKLNSFDFILSKKISKRLETFVEHSSKKNNVVENNKSDIQEFYYENKRIFPSDLWKIDEELKKEENAFVYEKEIEEMVNKLI